MKKCICFILTLLFVSTTAFADEKRMYFQATGMLTSFNDMEHNIGDMNDKIEVQDGMGLSAAIGYKFSKYFRGEIEYSYREAGADSFIPDEKRGWSDEAKKKANEMSKDSRTDNKSLMVNGIYDADFGSIITPYAGLGLGATWVSDSQENAEFTYQLMAGISLEATDDISLLAGYKYIDSSDWSYTSYREAGSHGTPGPGKEISGSFSAHNFEFGARFAF